jgi:hypothetical protein
MVLGADFFGFAVDSNFCQILFDSVVMNLDLPVTRSLLLEDSTSFGR